MHDYTNSDLDDYIANMINIASDGNERVAILLAYSFGRVIRNAHNRGANIMDEMRGFDLKHVADWIKASITNEAGWLFEVDTQGRPLKLMKFGSLENIMKEADKAMFKLAQRMGSVKLSEGDEEHYYELEDGYRLVRLLTPEALDKESHHMQHCIGDGAYDDDLDNPDKLFLSLRDKHGKPHATLEIDSDCVEQLQGKQNQVPDKKYVNYIIPFFQENNFNVKIPFSDLGCIIDKYGTWHKIDNLPDQLECDGEVDLRDSDIEKLPSCFSLTGSLDLNGSAIKCLPENLHVPSFMDIRGTKINKLPSGLIVDDELGMYGTNITELPDDLIVGFLNLRGTKIRVLPPSLTVLGYLDVSYADIDVLPVGLKPPRVLCIREGQFKTIPDNLRDVIKVKEDKNLSIDYIRSEIERIYDLNPSLPGRYR